MQIIKLADLSDGREFLSGLVGRRIYPKMIQAIEKSDEPRPVFLDFSGVVASGSFFSHAVFPLRNFARRMGAYIVLSNLNADSEDELRWLLDMSTDAVYVCGIDGEGGITEPRWLGNLDEKQRLTLEAVLGQTTTDAAGLAEQFSEEDIQRTGWNNRLAALYKKGLLMEIRSGRSKSYRPVLEIGN